MSSNQIQVNKILKNSKSTPCMLSDKKKSVNYDKIAENFIESIFQSVNEELNNEKETVSKFISSLFEEVQNELMITKFVDTVFLNAKSEVLKVKNKFNIVQFKPALQDKNTKDNCAKFCGNNSSLKIKKVVFSKDIDSKNSNKNASNKESKCNTRTISRSCMKNKRNYSMNKSDVKNNSKMNWYKNNLSVKYRTKAHSDKEKHRCEEKLKLMQKHISVMKRRQEEMDKKISFLKNKEENIKNIKKEKASLKKALINVSEKKKSELIKIRKHIEKQKEEINNRIKQSSGKIKLEKMKNYKKIKEEKKELNNKIKLNQQKNNSNVKRLIQKIRVLRAFNRNIVPQKKKIIDKNNNELNKKEIQKNKEITYSLKKQITKLQNEENEYIDKLNKTKAKLSNFDSEEKSYSNFNYKTYKKAKSYVINF